MKAALLALALLAGCSSTPRERAEDTCHFLFFAALPNPLGVVGGAAACTFGLRLLPDAEQKPVRHPEDDSDV